jgi:acyl carrier protein
MSQSISIEDVSKTIRQNISEILEVDVALLENGDKNITEITHVDSIQILDMVTAVEKAFKISIHEDEFKKMNTINSLTGMVIAKKHISAS